MDLLSYRSDYVMKDDVEEEKKNPLRDLILRRVRFKDSLTADHSKKGEFQSIRLLIRTAAKVTASSQWSTLFRPSAEDKHDAYKMSANSVRRDSALSEKKEDSSEIEINLSEKKVDPIELFYKKILNVLISHLLILQLRNAFYTERSWEAFSNEQIKENLFKSRWYIDYADLMQQ